MLLLASFFGCQEFKSSRSICDAQFGPETNLVERAVAPENYQDEIIRPYFSAKPELGIDETTFSAADIVWYQRDSGESVACVVFEDSGRVNGYFVLSEDLSVSAPVFLRVLGPN